MEFFVDLSKYIEQHGVHMVLNSQMCYSLGHRLGGAVVAVTKAQFELSNHKNV